MTGDLAESEEAVQEAFVRAWSHRGKIDARSSPEAWVRTTAWHIAVSRWRRARLGRLLMRAQLPPEVTDGPGPDRVAVIDALRKVPADQRRALVLYHLCELTVAQIADETSVPAGTVKARLARDGPSRLTCPMPTPPAGGWHMADLEEELQRLAAQAAADARPRPPGEVLRRGDGRRRRRIAGIAGVAAVAAVAAGVLGATAGAGSPIPLTPATHTGPNPNPSQTPVPSQTPAPSQRPAPSATPH